MKSRLGFLLAVLAAFMVMVGGAQAAAPVLTVDALLTGIDFTTVLTAILGIVAAGIVFYLGKGAGVQVMMFVRRILGA